MPLYIHAGVRYYRDMRYQIGSDKKDADGKTVRATLGSFSRAKELCDALHFRHGYAFWVFDTRRKEMAYSRSASPAVSFEDDRLGDYDDSHEPHASRSR